MGEWGKRGKFVMLASRTALAVGMVSASPAFAQDDEGGSGDPITRSESANVIIVTAQKREELLTEVPVAVSAFSGEELEARGITAADELAVITPGLFLTTGESVRSSRINIRGITSTPTTPGFEPGVTIIVDGVAQGRATTFNSELLDIESIQVLRGPQNTLFGRSSVAGVINVTTKKPDPDELSGQVSFDYANFDEVIARGVINAPLANTVALRLGGFYKERDGFLENTFLGVGHNDIERFGVRGSLLVEFSDNWELVVRGSYTEDESIGNTFEPIAPPGEESNIDRIISQDFLDEQTRSTYDISATVEGEIGGGITLTSITAYGGFEFFAANDQDRTPADFLVTGITEDQWQFSQELQLVSPSDGPIRWVGGLFFFKQNVTPDAFANFGDAFVVPAFRGVDAVAYIADIDVTEYAIFGQGDFDIAERLKVTLGLRYGRSEKDVVYDQRNPFVPAFVAETSLDDEALEGTAKLTYQIAPDSIIYAAYSRGEKAGGFNVPGDLFVGAPIDTFTPEEVRNLLSVRPEKVDSFEGGLRGVFLDRRLTTTLTSFYTKYKNRQVFEIEDGGVIPSVRSLNRDTDAFGVEFEANFIISENVTIGGTYGFLDTEIVSETGDPAIDAVFDGNDAERSPRHQATLYGQADFPIAGDIHGRIRGDLAHVSSWFDEDENQLAARADAYTLVNVRAGVGSLGRGWNLDVYVNNLFNETFVTDFLSAGAAVTPNIGRRYGARLTFTF